MNAGFTKYTRARRGYKITGLDLSSKMLAEARKVSEAENLDLLWKRYMAVQRENGIEGD